MSSSSSFSLLWRIGKSFRTSGAFQSLPGPSRRVLSVTSTTDHPAITVTTTSRETSNNNRSNKLQNIQHTIDEITGVHEISSLKQAVTDASEHLESCTQKLQDLRRTVDTQSAKHQELSAQYHEMMNRRHEWNEADVHNFAQLTAHEGKARSLVEESRAALQQAETHWQEAQTAYLDAVRRRYHEEQVWHDKWRVLGTYWTWALIALNSVVFIVGQALHYRRETLRLQSLHDMIEPLTEAAVYENRERKEKEKMNRKQALHKEKSSDTTSVDDHKDSETDAASQNQTIPNGDGTTVPHEQAWKEALVNWRESSTHFAGQTALLLQSRTKEVSQSCTTIVQAVSQRVLSSSQKWIWQPTVKLSHSIGAILSRKNIPNEDMVHNGSQPGDNDDHLHWPSAILGAAAAGAAFVLLGMVRGSRS